MSVTTQDAKLPALAGGRALAPIRSDFGGSLPPFPFDPLLDAPAPRTRGTAPECPSDRGRPARVIRATEHLPAAIASAAWATCAR